MLRQSRATARQDVGEVERGRRIGEIRAEIADPSVEVAVRRWMAKAASAVDDLVAVAAARLGAVLECLE